MIRLKIKQECVVVCQKDMGNCVPAYKNKDPPQPQPMNLTSSAQIQSPTKDSFVRREHSTDDLGSRPHPPSMETSFRELSKTDENFFDSQPWLESDCEDFFSVNDSCSNSPNHNKSLTESLPDKNHSMDRAQNAIPEHSPTDKTKLLIELFRESLDDNDDEENGVNNDRSSKEKLEAKPATTFNLPPKSTSRSPYEPTPKSVHSSEGTPIYLQPRKEKTSVSSVLPSESGAEQGP